VHTLPVPATVVMVAVAMSGWAEGREFALGLLQPARTSTIDTTSTGSNRRSAMWRRAGLKLAGARRPGVEVRLESFMSNWPGRSRTYQPQKARRQTGNQPVKIKRRPAGESPC
jgi:hypothetical protein